MPQVTPSAASDRQSFSLDGLGSTKSIKDEGLYDEGKKSGVAENRKMRPRTVDDDNEFWSTYVLAAGESDRQILETWNKTLDSLLTFAALFSAVNTAFIIESYKGLQLDPTDTTNTLLRSLLRHRNDDSPLSELELGLVNRVKNVDDIVRVNSTLFLSLACSLLASFGAVLGKEMLAIYSSSVALTASSSPDQGRTRQRKYDGLENFRFRILMQMLPALLQISLVLFLIGIIDFMWGLNDKVAIVFMVPVILGLFAYLWSLVTALQHEDSPFQTSLSSSIRLLRRTIADSEARHSVARWPSMIRPRITEASNHLTEHMENIPYFRDRLMEVAPRVPPRFTFPMARVVKSIAKRLHRSWFMEKLRYFTFPFYICALGVAGYIVTGWGLLRTVVGALDPFLDDAASRHNTQDIESSDCVVWLLRNGNHSDVTRKALKTFPLLPADVLLKKQNSAVEPYASIYTSSLNRRPGDVEFRWDDPRLKDTITDAIIAGTALFHVLKSRDDAVLSTISSSSFQIDPDLYDAINDDENAQFDFPLATVIVCVQTQMGVTDWTVKHLVGLLTRYHTNVRSTRDLAALPIHGDGQPVISIPSSNMARSPDLVAPITIPLPSNASTNGVPHMAFQDAAFTAELMPPPIALLLDAVIYCSSQRYHWDNYYTVLRRFETEYEDLLELIGLILQERSDSMSIASHVALVVAAVQWHKRHEEDPDGTVFNKVKLSKIRSAWLTIDKRATFFENIVLAFNMASVSGDSPATLKIYATLLDITEHFLPKAMDASDKLEETWKVWWPKMAKIIPGLLRFIGQVSTTDYQTLHTALRVLARLLPDDWDLQKTQRNIATFSIPADLYCLSPLHPDHGVALSVLIASVFSTSHPASPQTREAGAEVLGWMGQFPGVEAALPTIINNPAKGIMYNQATGIPAFLMEMWKATNSMIIPSKQADYYEKFLGRIFGMNTQKGTLAYTVQIEGLAIGMANFYQFPYAAVTTRENFHKYLPPDFYSRTGMSTIAILWDLLNTTLETKETNFGVWPESFHTAGITEDGRFDDPNLTPEELAEREEELRLLREKKGLTGLEINTVWAGEALMLIWRRVRNIKMAGGIDFFFHEDIIRAVLDGFGVAYDRKTNSPRMVVSFELMREYLEIVINDRHPSEELRVRAVATIMELDAMDYVKREQPPPVQPTPQRRVSVLPELSL
ncbi:hypothetical protein FRC03_005865 [Tulasnella sp. 419]|nr:hypothetical protein FRC03_005865 [Tulasnella sp. 419]